MGNYYGVLWASQNNILYSLPKIINKKDTGLYRDDGHKILKNCNRHKTD